MTLLKEDLMNGYKMLNTKKRTQRMKTKSPIPLTTNQKQLTLEKFQEIQQGKQNKKSTFTPTVNHSEKRQSIIVYYRLDNKKKEKEFRYKKIGYEKALEEANKYVEELKIHHSACAEHQVKYKSVMNELLLKHKDVKVCPTTPRQTIAISERVFEPISEDENDDIRSEYESDDEKFYYD